MKKSGILSADTWVGALNWVGMPLVTAYGLSMFVYPLISTGFVWEDVQKVWFDWQSLNVGMLAFISSLIAFNISKYNAEKQKQRNFIASRAFLPEPLSELCDYLKSSSKMLMEALVKCEDGRLKAILDDKPPVLPLNYRSTFSQCISFSDPVVGDYLSDLLVKLQVHHSRINSLSEDAKPNIKMTVLTSNIEWRIQVPSATV